MEAVSGRKRAMHLAGSGAGRRGWGAAIGAVVLLFVLALMALAGGCIKPENPCGEGYCPPGYACIPIVQGFVVQGYVCQTCGNGVVDSAAGEVCDDGNLDDGDGCSADCRSACGNGVVEAKLDEVCDDGNLKDGDACSADCKSKGKCGDGLVDIVGGEKCDCGAGDAQSLGAECKGEQNSAAGGYCRDDCIVHCGDGMVALEEVCDTDLPVTTSCAAFKYDFGRPGCSKACDSFVTASCGDWNWQLHDSGTSEDFVSVWGSGPNDVFAVGDSGTILHYDGQSWRSVDAKTSENLGGVWGSGPNDVFAVGDSGTIVHHDGQSWQSMDSKTLEPLTSVWGSGPNDVFAVGDFGTIQHYDGQSWVPMSSNPLELFFGVWGSGPKDVFAVSDFGIIQHYDGNSWQNMGSKTSEPLTGVWGSGPNDVFAVGDNGTIVHYDGQS
ncbi:MAG TPA: DUF4215 domain-containing protein, partial [Polyangiaceae bacterium]|nr:DUF4215 domain-containing protein [Polyangiaceae bacterium]